MDEMDWDTWRAKLGLQRRQTLGDRFPTRTIRYPHAEVLGRALVDVGIRHMECLEHVKKIEEANEEIRRNMVVPDNNGSDWDKEKEKVLKIWDRTVKIINMRNLGKALIEAGICYVEQVLEVKISMEYAEKVTSEIYAGYRGSSRND